MGFAAITTYDSQTLEEMENYIAKRIVKLTTKNKSVTVGNTRVYFNYDDKSVARVNKDQRRIELTSDIDSETFLGLKEIITGVKQ